MSGTYLKENKPDVKVMAVEPPSGEIVDGLRSLDDGFIPPVFDKWGGLELLDGKRIVRPVESIEYTRRLASDCGIFAGLSSGAAAAGAVRVAERVPEGETATVVFIVCDGGWKYLSTGAWTDDIDEVAAPRRRDRVLLGSRSGTRGSRSNTWCRLTAAVPVGRPSKSLDRGGGTAPTPPLR